uniref:Uncharacterized protein n=1 Tax=Rhizophora mucronata TaxID=61149 RepID=A0A2P2QZN8_RHIMU
MFNVTAPILTFCLCLYLWTVVH